jgi:hypothetical protein
MGQRRCGLRLIERKEMPSVIAFQRNAPGERPKSAAVTRALVRFAAYLRMRWSSRFE